MKTKTFFFVIKTSTFGLVLHSFAFILTAILFFLAITPVAFAETLIRIPIGGYKTLSPSRPIERVLNHNPEIVRIEHNELEHTLRVTGLDEGHALIDLVSKTRAHRDTTRKYRVIVRGDKPSLTQMSPGLTGTSTSEDLQSWLRTSFKALRGRTLGGSLIIEGRLNSLEEFKKLESLALGTEQSLIPAYEIPDDVLDEIVSWLGKRLSRAGFGSAELIKEGGDIILVGPEQALPELRALIGRYSQILPGLSPTLGATLNQQTQVKVTMHFVESTTSDKEENSQRFSGAHFPIRGEWSVGGFDQAPFQFYLRHLNETIGAKVIDQPALVTRSGSPATLHSGGDIAYRGINGTQEVSTEFRSFGLSAVVRPTVLQNSNIDLDLELEISEPSSGESSAPSASLSTRKVQSQVSLEDGMARLVARLKRQKREYNKAAPPLLGSIPVLSWLVTSQSETRRATELWIFVSATSSLYQDFNVAQDNIDSLLQEFGHVSDR